MSDGNVNIVHVEAIEGLAVQIGERISKLVQENTEQHEAKYEALDYLANYEVNQISNLRKAFE